MLSPPPNATRVAEQSVVPVTGPPFRWAAFATAEAPEDVVAFYAKILGRAPDHDGSRWSEPRGGMLLSVAVHPADRLDGMPIPPGGLPAGARTVVMLSERDPPPPEPLEPHRDNWLPADITPAGLLESTLSGSLIWKASEKGPVFLLAGRGGEELEGGREVWVALGRTGRLYSLTLTCDTRPVGEEVRQRDGWFRRCELGRLWRAIERSPATRRA